MEEAKKAWREAKKAKKVQAEEERWRKAKVLAMQRQQLELLSQ